MVLLQAIPSSPVPAMLQPAWGPLASEMLGQDNGQRRGPPSVQGGRASVVAPVCGGSIARDSLPACTTIQEHTVMQSGITTPCGHRPHTHLRCAGMATLRSIYADVVGVAAGSPAADDVGV